MPVAKGKKSPLEYDVVVIGGGFYGVSVALMAREFLESSRILILDSEAELLSRASKNNQARVHGGYHYPLSLRTGLSCRNNFSQFVARYGDAIKSDFDHLYAISRKHSAINASQFENFCKKIKAPYADATKEQEQLFDSRMIERVFSVKEFVFDYRKLVTQMKLEIEQAGIDFVPNTSVTKISKGATEKLSLLGCSSAQGTETYQARFVFNCTYASLNTILAKSGFSTIDLKYEMAEVSLVEVPDLLKSVGITVMCGPFFSLLPFPAQGVHSLSHVSHTPHLTWSSKRMPENLPSPNSLKSSFPKMVRDASRYVPHIISCDFKRSFFETKALPLSAEQTDARPIILEQASKQLDLYSLLGGKIDNVFDCKEEIGKILSVSERVAA